MPKDQFSPTLVEVIFWGAKSLDSMTRLVRVKSIVQRVVKVSLDLDGNTRGSATDLGSENIAGGGRKEQPPKQKGSVEIKGFTTFRVPMTDHDYGTNKDEVKNLAMASWFTQGLKEPAKYGATMKGLGGRSTNSRSGGKQTRDNSKDGGGGGYQ